MDTGADFFVSGVGEHIEQGGIQEGFSAVVEVDVAGEGGRLVENPPKEVEGHQPFFRGGHFFIWTHDTAQVAGGGGFDPQADGGCGDGFLSGAVIAENVPQVPEFKGSAHGIYDRPMGRKTQEETGFGVFEGTAAR